MQKHWLHPLSLLVVMIVAATMVICSLEFGSNVGNAMQHLHQSALAGKGWNWAHIIGGVVYVIGFSAGLVGAVVNLSNAIRLYGAKVKDFSAIREIDVEEVRGLHLWLDSNTYGPEHLQGLWGEEPRQ